MPMFVLECYTSSTRLRGADVAGIIFILQAAKYIKL